MSVCLLYPSKRKKRKPRIKFAHLISWSRHEEEDNAGKMSGVSSVSAVPWIGAPRSWKDEEVGMCDSSSSSSHARARNLGVPLLQVLDIQSKKELKLINRRGEYSWIFRALAIFLELLLLALETFTKIRTTLIIPGPLVVPTDLKEENQLVNLLLWLKFARSGGLSSKTKEEYVAARNAVEIIFF